ncbi:MAG: alanine racemase [candidate division Zixibacteria bacterium]|nr:alanine racemase [candidate division Zixibacteria bacterium]
MSENILQKTWVEIDCDVLRNNLRLLHQAIGTQRAIVLVVKSDAYGHGACTVANIAAAEGVRHFAVAAVEEGAALRRADINDEIILLHPPLDFEIGPALEARLSPTISDLQTAVRISEKAAKQSVGVHVEINTGVNRLGFDWQTAPDTIAQIAALPKLHINGVYTHFRSSDGSDGASIKDQLARFQQVLAAVERKGIPVGLRHAAASLVAARFPDCHLDGVRPGLIVYTGAKSTYEEPGGGHDESATRLLTPLEQSGSVMSVRTRVLHVRTVEAGEWIHYGEGYRAPRRMTIAVLPIGYGMGYSRLLTNNADVLLRGRRVPVVGTVGMDMTIVAVDDTGPVAIGDVATVIGRDGQEEITAAELAARAGTIPYEILCSLGNSLPRCVINERESQTQSAKVARSVAG